MLIERIYHHPNTWEDYKNGMYDSTCGNQFFKLAKAVELLKTPWLFKKIGQQVVEKWPFASEHNLTNMSRNRRAWVGQASCCFFAGVPEFLTKDAWHQLSDIERIKANKVADEIIMYFIKKQYLKSQIALDEQEISQ